MCRATVGDVEVGGERFRYGLHDVLERHVEEGAALDVVVGGRVETDVDASACIDHVGRVPRERFRIENVDGCDAGGGAGIANAFGDPLERLGGASGEVHGGSFAGVRAGDGGADRAACSVDDRCLVVEWHRAFSLIN